MPSARGRARAVTALSGALALAGAAALAVPSASLAAQGDDEVVISVIEQASPAVVTIQVPPLAFGVDETGDVPEGFELPEGFEMPEGFQLPFGGPGGFPLPSGTGSGVIIDDGLIITNGHVVGGATDVQVILADGTVLDGTVSGVDTLTDFAFVTVDAQDLPTVPLGDSSAIRVGQLAIAIGNPLGTFPGSASVGIVSGLDRSIGVFGIGSTGNQLNHLIQLDAAVNPGNSGGAVLNGDGELIGITTAEAGLSDGIGFALPIDLAKPIIEQARAGEPIARPYIGVLYREIDGQVASDEGLPVEVGAWIRADEASGESAVVSGSPADEAGIQDGDIITAVEGAEIDLDNPLDLEILKYAPGQEVTITVLRDGTSVDLPTTLGTRPTGLG